MKSDTAYTKRYDYVSLNHKMVIETFHMKTMLKNCVEIGILFGNLMVMPRKINIILAVSPTLIQGLTTAFNMHYATTSGTLHEYWQQ
jgi:uncharacterized membrane protein YjgN (DUF898 family)